MPTKKNNPVPYVQDTPTPATIQRWDIWEGLKRSQLLLSILSVVVIIAGTWIASLLAPLKQDIAVIQRDAEAKDARIDNLEGRLIRIEDKLDRALGIN